MPSTVGVCIAALTGGAAVGVSALCFPFVSVALRRVCLPYVPATDVQVANVLTALSRTNKNAKVLDIGSGDGRIVLAAAEQGYRAHGVELNPWLVLYSRADAARRGLSPNVAFHRRDLWKFPIGEYDALVIFGVDSMMAPLRDKIVREVKKDALIVACRYPFEGVSPENTIGGGVDTVWTYKTEHL